MAIFGELRDLPFGELSRVLAAQTGSLTLERVLDGRNAELHLHEGELRALFVDGFPVRDMGRLHQLIQQLGAESAGLFEFQALDLHELSGHHRLRLYDLLQAQRGEQPVAEEQLPHSDTRFVLGPRRGEAPRALWSAWALIQPLLQDGASAAELARRLELDLQQVRVMLHGLRGADLISPLRASAPGHSSAPASGPIQRLLGALRRLTGARA